MPRAWAVAVLLILLAGFASAVSAEVAPIVDGVPFLIRFRGPVRGLARGAPVEIQGIRIGEVVSVDVRYAVDSNSFVAPVKNLTLSLACFQWPGCVRAPPRRSTTRPTCWCGAGCGRRFRTRNC